MIRQAISCDVCGAEKKQTNHWFVAYTREGELRMSPFDPAARLRSGTRHLCGQTCLHKLLDEFFAGAATVRSQVPLSVAPGKKTPAATDTILIAKPLAPSETADPHIAAHSASRVLPVAASSALATSAIAASLFRSGEERRPVTPAATVDESPNYASRRWRAEAWERERDRERRSAGAARRHSS